MSVNSQEKLVIAISSRALFDLSESHQVFTENGLEAYSKYQIDRESDRLEPGDAFPLVKKLLRLNELLGEQRVEVVLMSRNSADTGLRIFNSIEDYGLSITRAAVVRRGLPSPFPTTAIPTGPGTSIEPTPKLRSVDPATGWTTLGSALTKTRSMSPATCSDSAGASPAPSTESSTRAKSSTV